MLKQPLIPSQRNMGAPSRSNGIDWLQKRAEARGHEQLRQHGSQRVGGDVKRAMVVAIRIAVVAANRFCVELNTECQLLQQPTAFALNTTAFALN